MNRPGKAQLLLGEQACRAGLYPSPVIVPQWVGARRSCLAIAQDIRDDLEADLEQFAIIAEDLK